MKTGDEYAREWNEDTGPTLGEMFDDAIRAAFAAGKEAGRAEGWRAGIEASADEASGEAQQCVRLRDDQANPMHDLAAMACRSVYARIMRLLAPTSEPARETTPAVADLDRKMSQIRKLVLRHGNADDSKVLADIFSVTDATVYNNTEIWRLNALEWMAAANKAEARRTTPTVAGNCMTHGENLPCYECTLNEGYASASAPPSVPATAAKLGQLERLAMEYGRERDVLRDALMRIRAAVVGRDNSVWMMANDALRSTAGDGSGT